MREYREAYALGNLEKAASLLDSSKLKDDTKSVLLWHLEKGTLNLSLGNDDTAITHFQTSLELIDKLFTTKLSSKTSSFFLSDQYDEFYGSSYERSYAHYYLAKSLYSRYLKKGNKLDLQGARGTILAWDSYFSELQRSASSKTLYSNDLMLKVFGGQIHEISEIRNDKQIALQLYKDALSLLYSQGGIFSLFNQKSLDYIKDYEKSGRPSNKLYIATPARDDLRDFLHFKILSLTKEIRSGDFESQKKALSPKPQIVEKAARGPGNVVLILEEGLIPQKVGKPFNFGIKGAINSVDNSGAKTFIATVGTELLAAFAMNKLGLVPRTSNSAGNLIFAHDVTKLAVQEAAIEFELPMIENVPPVKRLDYFILDEKGSIVDRGAFPVVSENGEIAKVVLEEDAVSRYVKTGTRVAIKHLTAIVAAMKVYKSLQKDDNGPDFLAKTAAMATYIGASKGFAALEKADTRHWTTLPHVLRMSEIKLNPGTYQVGLGAYEGEQAPSSPSKILGKILVRESGKSIYTYTSK